ncbi:MAG: MFS transporter, partial [Sarcina sp.]
NINNLIKLGDFMHKLKIHYSWLILIACSFILFSTQGLLNSSLGIFLKVVSESLGFGLGEFTLYTAIGGLVLLIFLPISSIIFYKVNLRILLSVSILLMGGSFALMSFQTSLLGFYILGSISAIGASFIAYLAAPILINNWFIRKKGLAMGISVGSINLGGICGTVMSTYIITNYNWQLAYIILGVLSIILVLPFTIFIIKLKPENNTTPYGYNANFNDSTNKTLKITNSKFKLTEVLIQPSFYILIFIVFLIVFCSCLSIHLPALATNLGYSSFFITLIISISMIASLIGSFLLGFLNDKIGIKFTTLLSLTFGVSSMVLLLFFSTSKIALIFSLFLFGLMRPAASLQAPLIIDKLFSTKFYSKIYSIAQMILVLGGILAIPLFGYIYDLTNTYFLVLVLILILLILCAILTLLLFYKKTQ